MDHFHGCFFPMYFTPPIFFNEAKVNTTLLGYFCLGKTLSNSKNNMSCCTTD